MKKNWDFWIFFLIILVGFVYLSKTAMAEETGIAIDPEVFGVSAVIGEPTHFGTKESCESALSNGQYGFYKPKNLALHDKELVDGIQRHMYALPRHGCVEMYTKSGWWWVVQPEGTAFRAKVVDGMYVLYAREDCGNPVRGVSYPAPPTPVPAPTPLVQPATTPTPLPGNGPVTINVNVTTPSSGVNWGTVGLITGGVAIVAVVIAQPWKHHGKAPGATTNPASLTTGGFTIKF